MWRNGLWYKLHKKGIYKNSKVFNVVQAMYNNIRSCVFCNDKKSEFFRCDTGVRQGGNSSPLLFILFINDLEKYLLSKGNQYLIFEDDTCMNYLKIFILLYADDTVFLSNTPKGLQKLMDDLYSYCQKWKLNVNSTKTKVIIFCKRKTKKVPIFKCNNNKIAQHNGKFKKCQSYIKDQVLRAVFALLSKGRRLKLPVDIMLELFDRTIIPLLLYGCEVWGIENYKLLEAVELKFYKYMLGLKKSTPTCMVYGEL